MGAAALTSAAAVDDVDLDDTLACYQAMKELDDEESFTLFCLAKDLDSENY